MLYSSMYVIDVNPRMNDVMNLCICIQLFDWLVAT